MTARLPYPDDPSTPPRGWEGLPTPPAGVPVVPPPPDPRAPSGVPVPDGPTVRTAAPGRPAPAEAPGRPTPPHGFSEAPTRPRSERPSTVPARADRRARRRAGLAAVPTGAFPAVEATGGLPLRPSLGRHRPSWLRRLVGFARVLTGGMIALALVVAVVPLVLGTAGAGVDAVVGHLVAAVLALAATGVAAHRRVPTGPAFAAAGAVPVIVIVVLAVYWWA